MNKLTLLSSIICLTILAVLPVSAQSEKISPEINSINGEIPVIIKIDSEIFAETLSPEQIYSIAELEKVKKIEYSPTFRASLQDSAIVVNATTSWLLQVSEANLTGAGETVCIIDTGTDFSHPALAGKNKTCVIDCFEKSCVENCSISDDEGHGTHVAGIIAANSSLKGIAPDASLISLKVLDENGDSSAQGPLDIKNAIDWCVQNRNAYNISVISMSLGTTFLYSGYCDSSFSLTITPAINNATAHNVSVVASTGNSDSGVPQNFTHIASPACITNATSVSATNKDDSVSTYGHFNSITDFFAPGTSINSTYLSNTYSSISGTSMSTPHVAAALAILNQFKRTQSLSLSSLYLENTLKSTGKNITSSGMTIPRINIRAALISLDSSAPSVSLTSPANNSFSINSTLELSCSTSDFALKNLTFNIWSSNSLVNSTTLSLSGSSSNSSLNFTLPFGTYLWNCLATDENNNFASASLNSTFILGDPLVSLSQPQNNLHTNLEENSFVCNSSSSSQLFNATLFIWNSSSLVYSLTSNISGTSNSSTFSYNLSNEGAYSWNCLASTSNSTNFASSNFTLTYDLTPPAINSTSPLNNTWLGTGNFSITLAEEGSCNCSLDNAPNSTMQTYNNLTFTHRNSTLEQNSTHNLTFFCTDLSGNTNSSFVQFSVDLTSPQISLSSPLGGLTTNSTSITFVYSVTDNLDISQCELILNNQSVSSTSSTTSISRTLSVGSYMWQINCTDSAGNIGNSSMRTLTIQSTSSSSDSSSSSGGSTSGTTLATIIQRNIQQNSTTSTSEQEGSESLNESEPSNSPITGSAIAGEGEASIKTYILVGISVIIFGGLAGYFLARSSLKEKTSRKKADASDSTTEESK